MVATGPESIQETSEKAKDIHNRLLAIPEILREALFEESLPMALTIQDESKDVQYAGFQLTESTILVISKGVLYEVFQGMELITQAISE